MIHFESIIYGVREETNLHVTPSVMTGKKFSENEDEVKTETSLLADSS
jgi:hypothetical protein